MPDFRIHGDNIVECERTLEFIARALSIRPNSHIVPFGSPLTPTWTFASGGSAAITGGVDLNGNGFLDAGDIAAGSTLLSGTFLNSPTASSSVGTDVRVAAGLILNSQNTALNQYFFGKPLAGPVWQGSLNLLFNPFGKPRPPGGTTALPTFVSKTIVSGSLLNTNAVPEPGSVLLFSSATGFLGIGLMLRRRRANRANG